MPTLDESQNEVLWIQIEQLEQEIEDNARWDEIMTACDERDRKKRDSFSPL